MQFGRYEITEETKKSMLPNEWTEELVRTLSEAYYVQSEKDNSFFDVYGEITEKEFVVVASYLHHEDQMKAPISLFISHDVVDDSKAFKKVLKSLVDLTGEIFDDAFASDDGPDYVATWTGSKYKTCDFHYKITRENISLTVQAEAFLEKDGDI